MPDFSDEISSFVEGEYIKAKGNNLQDLNKVFEREEEPVPFNTFCLSEEHMNFPPLSDRQLAAIKFLLGDNINDIFANENTTAVLEVGKGSGKDTIAALVLLYIIYWCLCLKDPQSFFNLPNGESIDLINIARASSQATNVFYEKVRQRLLRWKWLNNKYRSIVSGIPLRPTEKIILENEVHINLGATAFPKGLRLFSRHSDEESSEGLNILVAILDEVSAFTNTANNHNAKKVYDMVRTSARTRFGNKFKIFMLSYPRYKDDFIETMYKIGQKELHWYADKAFTWQMKPRKYFSEKTFNFHGIEIPIDFQEDFRLEPEVSSAKYLCMPPETESPFIKDGRGIVDDLMKRHINEKEFIVFEDVIINSKISKKIIEMNFGVSKEEYLITFDLGEKFDSAAMSITHYDDLNRIVIDDLTIAWEPDPEKEIIVDFINVEDIIVNICRLIRVRGVFFDRWQSSLIVQRLQNMGIPAEKYSLYYADYVLFRRCLRGGEIDFAYNLKLKEEIIGLQEMGNRVDRMEGAHKDRVDTVVGAIKVWIGAGSRAKIGKISEEEGEIVRPNVQEHGVIIKKIGSF